MRDQGGTLCITLGFSEWFKIFFTLSNAKHGGKYWNRSRGKLDFKGSSGKDYGTQGLN